MAHALTLIGIGNRYRTDDGIGIRLVEDVSRLPESPVACRVWEAADALTVVHELLELDRPALVVDCADMGLRPGTCGFFDEAQLAGQRHALTTHGFGMGEAIGMARALGYRAPIWFMGIQPESLEGGEALSPSLESAYPLLQERLLGELGRLREEGVVA